MALPVCHTLWIGDRLPPLLAVCLESFVRQGHRVELHAYRSVEAPRGVTVRDASAILPYRPAGSHQGHGAIPVFADWFRYELLERVHGIWIDTDLVCVRPIALRKQYLFGYDSGRVINNAVLRLPSGSALLRQMRDLFPGHGFIPPWFGPVRRLRYRVKHLCGIHRDITTLPHASSGPAALTWYANEQGVADQALPPEAFYPLCLSQCSRALNGDFDIAGLITPRTLCVHLWHNSLPSLDPHPHSLIGRLLARDFQALVA